MREADNIDIRRVVSALRGRSVPVRTIGTATVRCCEGDFQGPFVLALLQEMQVSQVGNLPVVMPESFVAVQIFDGLCTVIEGHGYAQIGRYVEDLLLAITSQTSIDTIIIYHSLGN